MKKKTVIEKDLKNLLNYYRTNRLFFVIYDIGFSDFVEKEIKKEGR